MVLSRFREVSGEPPPRAGPRERSVWAKTLRDGARSPFRGVSIHPPKPPAPRAHPAPSAPRPRQEAQRGSNLASAGETSGLSKNFLLPEHGSVASTPRDTHRPLGRWKSGDTKSRMRGLRRPAATKGAAVSEPRTPTAASLPRLCGTPRKRNSFPLDPTPGADYKPSPTDGVPNRAPPRNSAP